MTADAVVLVHGTRTSHSQWDLQVPSLLAAGYEVVLVDLPGHGTRRDEAFTLEAATATITDATRDATGNADRVHVVGSSLGGMLAIHAAASAPAGLASVVVCGASVQPSPWTAALYGALIRAVDVLPGGSAGTSPAFRLLLGENGTRAYLRGGRAQADVVAPAFTAVASLDMRADLARIEVPVTFLHGRFDQLRLHERSFLAAARHGHLEVLPYGTHLVNLNRPERFTADLLRVLAAAAPTLGT